MGNLKTNMAEKKCNYRLKIKKMKQEIIFQKK